MTLEPAALLAMAEPTDGTIEELAERYKVALQCIAAFKTIAETIEDDLAARMENDSVPTRAGRLYRNRTYQSTWMDEHASSRFRNDIGRAVVTSVALDIGSGEVDPVRRNIARATVELLWEIVPAFSNVKQRGKAMGIDLDEYRTSRPVYKVTLDAAQDDAWEDS